MNFVEEIAQIIEKLHKSTELSSKWVYSQSAMLPMNKKSSLLAYIFEENCKELSTEPGFILKKILKSPEVGLF